MNLIHEVTTEQIHHIADSDDVDKRFANVHVVNGKFSKCLFRTGAPVYSLEDWEFIHALSEKILQITRS